MILRGENRSIGRKPCPNATFSSTDRTRISVFLFLSRDVDMSLSLKMGYSSALMQEVILDLYSEFVNFVLLRYAVYIFQSCYL